MLDLLFPVQGESLPTDHGYLLYSAASHLSAILHDPSAAVRPGAVTGANAGGGWLALNRFSHWRIRTPETHLRDLLALAGKQLRVGEHAIRLGAPTVATLEPAPSLYARIVTFKKSLQPRPQRPLPDNVPRPKANDSVRSVWALALDKRRNRCGTSRS